MGKSWENEEIHRKIMGKWRNSWENHRKMEKFIGKSWENGKVHGKILDELALECQTHV
jgi:hypothetical protein